VSRFLMAHGTIRLYSAIHVGSRWKIQGRRQIKNTHNTQTTKTTGNKQTTQNKTSLVQSLLTTLGQETRWAYCAMLLSPHVAVTSQQPVCVVEPVAWLKDNATCTHCPSGFETSRTKMAHRGDMHYTEGYTIYMFRATTVSR